MSLCLSRDFHSLHHRSAVLRQAESRSVGRQLTRIELVPCQAAGEARISSCMRHLDRLAHERSKDAAARKEAIALQPSLDDLQTLAAGAVDGLGVAMLGHG